MTTPAAPSLVPIDYTALVAAMAASPALVNALATALRAPQSMPAAPAPAPAVMAMPANVAAAPPVITLASIEAHVNALLPLATIVMAAIPATAPFAPALSIVQKAIVAATSAVATVQSNPADLADVLAASLADIAPLVGALKPVSTQWPWLTNLETILGNIGNALAPPAVTAAAAPAAAKAA